MNLLYTYSTLNKEYFKSGRYVEFEVPITEVTTNVSRYEKEGSYTRFIPKFYKVKLFHQLNNGYLDLTTDVWTQFLTTTRTTKYWFNNAAFLYYCPTQYKGKLVSSLEIEDLYKFSLYGLPNITLNNDASYKFYVEIDALAQNLDDTNLRLETGAITIPKIKLETWYEGSDNITTKYEYTASLYSTTSTYIINNIVYIIDVISKKRIYYKNISGTNNPDLGNIIDWTPYFDYLSVNNIPSDKKNTIIHYKMTPVLSTLGDTTLYEGDKDLPIEFIDKYTIEGTRRITTEYDNITFKRVNNNYNCDIVNGTKTYNEYILTNTSGIYLNANLETSDTPLIFLKEGSAAQSPLAVIITSYTVNNKRPTLILPLTTIVDDFILSLFKIIEVEEASQDCVVITYPTLTLNFNIPLSLTTEVKVFQNGELVYSLTNSTLSIISFDIASNIYTTIQVVRTGYRPIVSGFSGISINTSLNLGFIADVKVTVIDTYYKLIWQSYFTENLPVISQVQYFLTGETLSSNVDLIQSSSIKYETQALNISTYGNFMNALLTQVGAVDIAGGTYFNIDAGKCAIFQGTILNKLITW